MVPSSVAQLACILHPTHNTIIIMVLSYIMLKLVKSYL